MFKTKSVKIGDIDRKWYLVDLKGLVLGRASTKIASLLIGKDKQPVADSIDLGDYVVAINAGDIEFTGRKLTGKKYYSHSGYPGGFKEMNLKRAMEKDPTWVIKKSVKGMLPKNKLQSGRIARLFVFPGKDHDKAAQTPEEIKIK